MSQISRGSSNSDIAGVPKVFFNPVGAFGQSIYCGPFWGYSTTADQPRFFWEAWVCPLTANGGRGSNWVSEGSFTELTSAHAIACSPSDGNIWNGTTITSWTSDYTPPIGRWMHVACSWDGTNIRHYVDGIVTAVVPFIGPRRVPNSWNGGPLFIAGSDFNTLHGKIGMIRGWEGTATTNPLAYYSLYTRGFGAPFTPLKSSVPWDVGSQNGNLVASFCMDLTIPGMSTTDSSEGYGGRRHPGTLEYNAYNEYASDRPSGWWVDDPTCPLRQDRVVLPIITIPPLSPAPAGAKIFDGFSRTNSLWCYTGEFSTLGSTESGSLGPQPWLYKDSYYSQFGIFDGRAISHAFEDPGAAWVASVGSPDMDVRVDRRNNSNGLNDTSVCLRVVDKNNMLFVTSIGGLNSGTISLNSLSFVTPTLIANYPYTAAYTTLRVVASGTTINIYADATLIGTATGVTTAALGQGAGIFSVNPPDTARRWDNFTVF